MNSALKCFIIVAIVFGYIWKTEAMGLCAFRSKFPDKIQKPSQDAKNDKIENQPSTDVVTQREESSVSVSYVESMTSVSEILTTSDVGTFQVSTDSPCSPYTVNEPFVNENCTKRCFCNSIGSLNCSDYSCGDNSTCGVENGVRVCYCDDGFIKREQNCSKPVDCHDLYSAGIRENGTYTVYPPGWPKTSMQVYCHMESGGWTVFQRRVNGSVDFYRNWTEYKNGFGSLDHEFWLGNDALYHLTNQGDYRLRVDLENDSGKFFVVYDLLRIGNETSGYKLLELGNFASDGVDYDALRDHVTVPFSTYDRDMDLSSENCAQTNRGGWWFTNCHTGYLNGVYGQPSLPGIRWYRLKAGQYNLKRTEMKICPGDCY